MPTTKPTHLGRVMAAAEARQMLANILGLKGDGIHARAFAIASGWPLGEGTLMSESLGKPPEPPKITVTVCAECHRACCWYGEFMCDESRGADVTEMTKAELAKLDLESPYYWEAPYT